MSKRESVLEGVAIRLLAAHTNSHTRIIRRRFSGPSKMYPNVSRPPPHLVWGRVVPDIPDFCRELVAALAED